MTERIPSSYYTTIEHKHYWNAAEDKPTGSDITKGATGLEIDTNKVHRWNGDEWIYIPGGGDAEVIVVDGEGDALFTDVNPAKVAFDGDISVTLPATIPEYQWLHSDTPPTLELEDRAFGVQVNSNDSLSIFYWTGTSWQGVV